jgi:cytochrome c5
VSTQDTKFFNTFSLVIGLLIAVTLAILAFARSVAARTEVAEVYSDAMYVASVDERVKPFAREAVAGQDNSAMKIEAPAGGATIALAVPKDGPALYDAVCKTCHGTGLAGAPTAGNKALWGPRIAKGKATLYDHALHGFTGTTGVMPAKGGRPDLSDDLVKSGVDYLVSLAQK